MAVIDDPGRFRSSQEVGAYLGLVPRRWQSGQLDQAGRITRCGDGLLRHLLYECANVILSILKQPCGLKDWAERPTHPTRTGRAEWKEASGGDRGGRAALPRHLEPGEPLVALEPQPHDPLDQRDATRVLAAGVELKDVPRHPMSPVVSRCPPGPPRAPGGW